MPRETNFLVVCNRFGGRTDGGAFKTSYSMLIDGPVNHLSSVIWGHLVAHEVLHFWNGHTLVPKSNLEEWLKEGFTDYLTILVRSRAGLDSRERAYRKLENSMRRYMISKTVLGWTDSIREAGADKHTKRPLVYGGGTVIAFVLDVRIREATGNAKSLEDFMTALFSEFGVPGRGYDLEDVIRVASAVSGRDQRDFFQRYVDGTELLNVAPYARAAGLQLDAVIDEFYIGALPDAGPGQRAITEGIFGAP